MDDQILLRIRSWLQAIYLEKSAPILSKAAPGGTRLVAIITRREFHTYLLDIGAPIAETVAACKSRDWMVESAGVVDDGQSSWGTFNAVAAGFGGQQTATKVRPLYLVYGEVLGGKEDLQRSGDAGGVAEIAEKTSNIHEDGPDGPDSFWWNGDRLDGLRQNVFRLLSLLWDSPGRKVAYEEVENDWGAEVADKTIRNASSDLSCWLVKAGIPITCRVKNRHVLLEE